MIRKSTIALRVTLLILAAGAGCAAPDAATTDDGDESVGVAHETLLAGSEWASAGNFVHIYDPSTGETSPWYFNDHTFFYDAAHSTWHLYGITNAEPAIPYAYDVDAERQFGHATASSITGTWTKKPNVLIASRTAPYGETHLWAPHVVADGGKYYMFYAGGGDDETKQEISVAISDDLNTWTRFQGGPLFKDGFQARDPFVTKINGEWVMYYTATNPAAGGNYVVAYRKAINNSLTSWGAKQIAFTDPKTGTDAGPTESPFVVQRGSWYYLFLGPRPYDGLYIPPDFPGTDVFASTKPFQFDVSQQVGHIAAHAAEVIQEGTSLWVSDAGWGLGGVYVAPLTFNSAPVSGSTLYALSPNRDAIKRYTGTGTSWTPIGGAASKLVTGGFGTFYVSSAGDIYRYDTGTSWTKIGGTRTGFAVNAIGLYAYDSTGVFKWAGGTTWDQIGGPASGIYAGANELYASNNITGDLYRYRGPNAPWEKVGGPGSEWAVNVNGVYGRNSFGVFHWTGTGEEWVKIGGPADKLYAGGNALYAKVPFFGDLNLYSNSPDTWSKASDPATSWAVCDDALYALRSSGVYKKTGASSWTQIGGAAYAIYCGK